MSNFWKRIKTSFWFVPTLLIVIISMLSLVLVQIDEAFFDVIDQYAPFLFGGTPDAARGLLSTIATSQATIVTVLFSITILAIQQTSAQYTSRILRNFTTDKGFQIVLGLYVSVYISSLLVLRSIRMDDGNTEAFVPKITTTFILLLVMINIGNLIYFINKISRFLQVSVIIKRIYHDLINQIDNLFPSSVGESIKDMPSPEELIRQIGKSIIPFKVLSNKTGFVGTIDEKSLNIKVEPARWIYIKPQVGSFLSFGETLAEIDGKNQNQQLNKLIEHIRKAVEVRSQRTIDADALFGFRQLVDLALRVIANDDQTTVEYCLNYIGDALGRLSQREFPENKREFQDNPTIIIFNRPSWEEYVEVGFSQIRQKVTSYPYVLKAFLKTLRHVAEVSPPGNRINPIKNQLDAVESELSPQLKNDPEIISYISQIRKIIDKKLGS